jgi:opacity protein-like surface antigen
MRVTRFAPNKEKLMKYYFLLLILSVTAITAAEQGGGSGGGRYVRVGLGAAFTENAEANFLLAGERGLELDPGFHLSVAGGVMFGDFFGLELETGFILNGISSISGFDNVDGYVVQVPFVANAVGQFRNRTALTPFIGAGAGGSLSISQVDRANSSVFEVEGSDAEVVFAWQLFGGLKYDLAEDLSLGILYKYFGTGDGARSHTISAAVSFSF